MGRLDEIETFVAIGDAKSLTEASRAMGVTLSVVSRRLRDLEARVEIGLVKRTTRKMILTNEGHDFYLRCRRILSDLEEAQTLLRNTNDSIKGHIRVAAPRLFADHRLGPLLNTFIRENMDVTIELDLNDQSTGPVAEGIDFAIRLGPVPDIGTEHGIATKRLTTIKSGPCASPALLAQFGRPLRPEDMGSIPALTQLPLYEQTRWDFTRPDGTTGQVRVTGRLKCSSGHTLLAAAEEGLGILCEPTFLTAQAVAKGRLVSLFAEHQWPETTAYVAFPTGRAMTSRARMLLDHVVQQLDDSAASGSIMHIEQDSLHSRPNMTRAPLAILNH